MKRLFRLVALSATAWAIGAARLGAPAQAEWNIDAYVGPTYSDDEDGETGEFTVGGRVGYFFPLAGKFDFGLFVDSSGVLDDDDGDSPRDFTFVPTTALGLLRYRLIESEGFALHPYLGAGPSAVWSELDVGDQDEDDINIGLDARGGLRAIIYDRFAVFTEYRLNYFEARYDLDGAPGVEVDDNYHAILFGLGYRFVSAPAPVVEAPPAPTPEPVVEETLPPPTKQRLVLRGVTFAFDGDELNDDAASILGASISALADSPDAAVVVEGHTDAVGSDAYNQKLSERRAKRVRDYLVEHGVDASRLEVRAFGETQPVADNDSEEGRAQNRRVELEVAE